MWFIGVEVEQETSAPPPKKNPGSAPVLLSTCRTSCAFSAVKKNYNNCYKQVLDDAATKEKAKALEND